MKKYEGQDPRVLHYLLPDRIRLDQAYQTRLACKVLHASFEARQWFGRQCYVQIRTEKYKVERAVVQQFLEQLRNKLEISTMTNEWLILRI